MTHPHRRRGPSGQDRSRGPAAATDRNAPGDRTPVARLAALEALDKTLPAGPAGQEARAMDIQAALDAVLSRRRMDRRDTALAVELAYGHARMRGRTAFLLSRYLKDPDGLPPPVWAAMSLAAHEMLHLDRIPAYASADWAVGRVKALAGPKLAGVANAVLRRLADEAPGLMDMDACRTPEASETTVLARHYSCPEWIVELWRKAYGHEAALRLLAAQAGPAPTGLRVNAARPDAQELFNRLASLPGCVLADFPTVALAPGTDLEAAGIGLEELSAVGRLSRQSAAAQTALAGLQPQAWTGPVYDACAGRGGKTTQLLETTTHAVWAADTHRGRLRALRRECARLGLPDIPVFAASGYHPPLGRAPGTVLLDAPCSGLGVLSRRPDAKWKRTPKDVAALARIQEGLLAAAIETVAPGGRVVYLTCTLAPMENREAVDRFVARNPEARLETMREPDPASPLAEFFFAAVIRRAA